MIIIRAKLINSLLPPNTLHLYYGLTTDFNLDELLPILSEDELQRVEKIKKEEDKQLYISCRAFLRKILARYLEMKPQDIEFEYGKHGKPSLKGIADIQFSLSHTRELFLLGFARESAVGVDVEYMEREIDIEKLSSYVFSNKELDKFIIADKKLQQELFMNAWTRKEAILKAKGSGLTFPMKEVEVSFLKEEKTQVLSTPWGKNEEKEWFLDSFDLPGGYRAAVAVNGQVNKMELFNINLHLFKN